MSTNGVGDLKKILAEQLGIPENEISDEDLKRFLEEFKIEVYLNKYKKSV